MPSFSLAFKAAFATISTFSKRESFGFSLLKG